MRRIVTALLLLTALGTTGCSCGPFACHRSNCPDCGSNCTTCDDGCGAGGCGTAACGDGCGLGSGLLAGHHGNQAGFVGGPPTGAITYPYYTNRGPRDFLARNPRGIGP